MSGRRAFGEGVLRVVMRLHPARFRREWADEMLEYYRAVARGEGRERGLLWRIGFLLRSLRAAAGQGIRQRLADRRAEGAPGSPERVHFLDTLSLDTRYALRSILRRRRFAAAVVLVLALGMGANTAVFGVLNAVLLRPLPYPRPDRLVRIYQAPADEPGDLNYVTAPAFVDLRDNGRAFDAVAAMYTYAETGADLTGAGEPIRVRTLGVTPDYFRVLGIAAVRGRVFGASATDPGVRAALVTESLAESRGIDVGGSVILDGTSTEIVGLLPAGYEDPIVGRVDVVLPLAVGTGDWEDWQWDNHYLTLVARLGPEASATTAQVDVNRRFAAMNEITPVGDPETGRVVDLHEDVIGSADTLLVLLMGAVGFLLLVACINVAGLFLARAASREQELAVRVALGSPRWRVVRQLLIESVVLSGAGAAAGLALGRVLSTGLAGLAPVHLVRAEGVPFDLAVFGFSAGMVALAGLVFGLAPALILTRSRIEQSLRQSGRSGGQGQRESRSRDLLVVAQLALSVILLVGAALLIRSFDRLRNTNLGFETHDVFTFEVNLPSARYDAAGRIRFHEQLHEQLSAIPGVRAVAAVSQLPVTGRALSWGVREFVDGATGGTNVQADQRTVQGDYFDAAGIPVIAGRVFSREDDASAPARVVISESLARRLFPEGYAVGRHLRVIGEPHEIIGVVGDAAIDARGEVAPIVYHAHRQFADNRNWTMRQIVALDGPVPGLLDAASHAVAAIDPALVLYRPMTLGSVVERGTARDRFATLLLATFALVAMLLAAVGVYGVLAYSVNRRRHEFGVRMALGARASDVRRMVVGRGTKLLLLSLVVGLLGAFALSGLLTAFVFGVGVRDPVSFLSATAVIGIVALMASLIPAVSATRTDPAAAFRAE